MSETNDIKSIWNDVVIALQCLFKKSKKTLNRHAFQTELNNFTQSCNHDDSDYSMKEFENDFTEYLKNKNYDLSGLTMLMKPFKEAAETEQQNSLQRLRNVKKITENLNEYVSDFSVFIDTTKMIPGLVCYVIEKIEPSEKTRPYVTYRSVPRVITSIHDSGVNGGTIFFTYNHKVINNSPFDNNYNVVSEEEIIYSPLTKEQADYICKLLNIQSKQVYIKNMQKIAGQKQRVQPER